MSGTISNVEIGDVDITVNGTHVGHTLGGATFTFEHEFAELKVDEYASPVDYALTAQTMMIKATLAEPTEINIARAMSDSVLETGSTSDRVHLGRKTGYLLAQNAVELVLHPRSLPAANTTKDITIYRAIAKESVELAYTVEDQRVLEITWTALPDESKIDGRVLGRIGSNLIS